MKLQCYEGEWKCVAYNGSDAAKPVEVKDDLATVVTGRVEQGEVNVGDDIEIVGIHDEIEQNNLWRYCTRTLKVHYPNPSMEASML